jgi:Xaa-Pro dipeptidase
VNFDSALDLIAEVTGEGLDLGERTPVAPDFPLEEYRRRYARLVALMERSELDAVVFTQEEPVRYFSGYNSVIWAVGRWLPTVFVATRDPRQALLVGSVFDAGCAAGTSWVSQVAHHQRPQDIPRLVADHLTSVGVPPDRIGAEYGPGSFIALPQPIARDLLALMGGGPRDGSALFHAVRMLKSPLELERIRTSVRAATRGYRAGLEAAHAGMSEKELVSVITSTMFREGSTAGTRPAFVNSVSGRDRYALVDTPASDRVLAEGDIVFVDGGAATDGYVSDILRLIAVGQIGADEVRFAEVAANATAAMVGAARPGITVSGLLDVARSSVAKDGCDVPVGAVAGHGIGLELWERPFIQDQDDIDEDVTLRPGMVLCLEPILAPPHPDGGLAGIFVFEQQVVVTEAACEVLSEELPASLWRATA